MHVRSTKWSRLLAVCAVALGVAPVMQAQSLGLQFHGFGGWYYGRSNDLQFIEATKGGNAQTAQFALNASAMPTDRLRIATQINFQEQAQGSRTQLDYAFVEFDAANRLKLRAGRAKHPFGIYGEIFDVGTARPFQHISQAIYGPSGFTGKAYNGAGITGSVGAGLGEAAWGLQYDLYGGEMDAEYEESGIFSIADPRTPVPMLTQKYTIRSLNKDVIGTRLQLNTPVEGLWVGASGFVAKVDLAGVARHQAKVSMGSVEYARGPFLLRAEAASGTIKYDVKEHAGYGEVAYKITPHWQIAGRVDRLNRDLPIFQYVAQLLGTQLPPFVNYRFHVNHTEKIVGLNYWLNPNVVFRASYSKVKGPALLYPSVTQLATYMQTGMRPTDEANVFLVGTQFSF